MRRAAKRDGNHAELVKALRQCGVFVVDLASVGDDVPDLLCGRFGTWKLLELKNPKRPPNKRRLSPGQAKFHADCAERGLPCFRVETLEEALSLFPAP